MKIKYNCPNLRGLGGDFVLKPGVNDVPDDVFEKWADHPQIVPLIKSGKIEVLDDKGKVIAPPADLGEDEPEAPKAKRGRKPKAEAPAQEPAKDPKAEEPPKGTEPTEAELAALMAGGAK
jgi:hypothetical protein